MSAEKDAYEVCDEGTRLHTTQQHRDWRWDHNPWSAACSKRLNSEPYCIRAICPTCNVGDSGASS